MSEGESRTGLPTLGSPKSVSESPGLAVLGPFPFCGRRSKAPLREGRGSQTGNRYLKSTQVTDQVDVS